jgi:Glutathione S-transferase, N-terminal domain
VKLYMFEHCYLCFRVRMTAALARKHLEEVVVLEDDTDTMVALAGRRVVPIVLRDDGRPMLESMDIVRYIDRLGEPVLTGRNDRRSGYGPNRSRPRLLRSRSRATPCSVCRSSAAPPRAPTIAPANAAPWATSTRCWPTRNATSAS